MIGLDQFYGPRASSIEPMAFLIIGEILCVLEEADPLAVVALTEKSRTFYHFIFRRVVTARPSSFTL